MQIISVKNSFYFTYVFLITTGTITFIEALRNPNPQIRHIMNLETCISIVAGYFYSLFIEEINKSEESILTQDTEEVSIKTANNELDLPIEKINNMRYSDWIISTPLMLLVLSLLLLDSLLSFGNKLKSALFKRTFLLAVSSSL